MNPWTNSDRIGTLCGGSRCYGRYFAEGTYGYAAAFPDHYFDFGVRLVRRFREGARGRRDVCHLP